MSVHEVRAEDRLMIYELLASYNLQTEGGALGDVADLFTIDGEFIGTNAEAGGDIARGRAELRSYFDTCWDRPEYAAARGGRHHTSNVVIGIRGRDLAGP